MVNNKVIVKEKDVWSDLANFIGEMVAKYAEAMDLQSCWMKTCQLVVAAQ